MSELLPCPFCGREAAEPHFAEEDNGSGGGWGEVYCTSCSGQVRGQYLSWLEDEEREISTETAVTLWNTRTDLSEAAISRARAEGRAEALRECREIAKGHRPDRPLQSRATADAIAHAIAALQETPDAE